MTNFYQLNSIEQIQAMSRIIEESDAASEGGWTWAFPNTPVVTDRANCFAKTSKTFVDYIKKVIC